MKTSIDIVAAGITAEAQRSDLLLLAPGVIGVSFNRYFMKPNSQINYPYVGRLALYPFDQDFDRVSDPAALQVVLDSVYGAYTTGRRVWFVADWRWVRPDYAAPIKLSRDSFGGIAQADRARANRLDRYLRWLYGRPTIELGVPPGGPGPEQFVAWLFQRQDAGPSVPATGGAP